MLRSSPSLLGDVYPAIIDLGRGDHNAPRHRSRSQNRSGWPSARILDTWERRHLLCEDLAQRVGRTGAQVGLVENASAGKTALEGAGIKVEGESEVIVMDLSGENRPGTLGMMARKVADAGVR